VFLKERLAES